MTTQKPKGKAPTKYAYYDIHELYAYYGIEHESPLRNAIGTWICGTPKRHTFVTNGCILDWPEFKQADLDGDDCDEKDPDDIIPAVVEEFIKACCEEFGEYGPTFGGPQAPWRKQLRVYYSW